MTQKIGITRRDLLEVTLRGNAKQGAWAYPGGRWERTPSVFGQEEYGVRVYPWSSCRGYAGLEESCGFVDEDEGRLRWDDARP